MDIAPHVQQVARALKVLEDAIAGLVAALAHEPVVADIEPGAADPHQAPTQSPIRRACEAYSAIDYRMDDEVESSVVCLGAIGVGTDILRRAKAVNLAKAQLKAICSPLVYIRIRIPVKSEPTQTRAVAAIRVILRSIQRSDLNLLAAYRKIPILSAPPASITYIRANTRAVYRKTIEEIYQLLDNIEGPNAIADRERLAALHRRETHLAFVKDRYQNIRANVVYARLDPRGRGRIQISAELPLLYAKGRRPEPPQVRFPASEDQSEVRRPRQAQLESTQYLRSIPVYRYTRTPDQ